MIVALLAVVLPYWLYSRSDPITQVSIPHASRDSFLVNPNAGLVFWLIPWGTTLLVLPYALIRGFASKAWPLAAVVGCCCSFFGTGGTTPIPEADPGRRRTTSSPWTGSPSGRRSACCRWPGCSSSSVVVRHHPRRAGRGRSAGARGGAAGDAAGRAPRGHPVRGEPDALPPVPAGGDRRRPRSPRSWTRTSTTGWRYLTLGFGDQMAWLSANTTAADRRRQLPLGPAAARADLPTGRAAGGREVLRACPESAACNSFSPSRSATT